MELKEDGVGYLLEELRSIRLSSVQLEESLVQAELECN